MKTEFEIAKENIKNLTALYGDKRDMGNCSSHKATCQRISKKVTNDILFLEQCIHFEEQVQKEGNMKTINITKLRMKLTEKQEELIDLKNTIKLYEDAGT